MKKIAQPPQAAMPTAPLAGISNIYMKRQELQKTINDALAKFKNILQTSQKQVADDATRQMNTIVQKLNSDVNNKLNEIQRLIPIATTPATANRNIQLKAYWLGGGGVNQPSPHKVKYKPDEIEKAGPRGDGDDTPMFWKHNFDYGYGPYTNMDKMEGKTITDYEDTMNKEDGRWNKNHKRKK